MIDRNAPCPCNSGKKYKKCCMTKTAASTPEQALASHVEKRDVIGLMRQVEKAFPEILDRCFEELMDPETAEGLSQVFQEDRELFENVMISFHEGVMAEMARHGAAARLGNRLSPPQVRYLQELDRNPLEFWEVLDVVPGRSLRLQSVEDESIVEVFEQSASHQIVPTQMVAARVVADASVPTMSNVLLFDRQEIAELQKLVQGSPEGRSREIDLERTIIRHYLRKVAVHEEPVFMDAGTGTLLEFVHDRYTVLDMTELWSVLDACEDLDEDPQFPKKQWVRVQQQEEDAARALAHLTLDGIVLEMVSRSRLAGENNRKWLKGVAGSCLKFRSRKVIDTDEMRKMVRTSQAKERTLDIPVDFAMAEAVYRSTYKNWETTPIPALGNRAPLDYAKSAQGRKAVLDLVREYQTHENKMAQAQKRDAIDLSWVASLAGLNPDEV